ncbi:hypothetical protein ACA910_021345 [Epithemia clementina (nom. ined.)]
MNAQAPYQNHFEQHKNQRKQGWDNPVITLINLYYPLGPCRTTFDLAQLPNILQILPNVFRTLSLETKYQDSPIAAKCQSLDQAEFVITLLQCRNNTRQVIMEIQRQSGDCMAFHRIAQTILAAVSSGHVPSATTTTTPNKYNMRYSKLLDSVGPNGSNHVDRIHNHDNKTSAVVAALEIAWGMLSRDRYDAQSLGLQSLVHITDPAKSGWSTAKTASSFILNPRGNIQANISSRLVGYVCGNRSDTTISSVHPDMIKFDFAYLSLVVLSQVFRLAAEGQKEDITKFTATCSAADTLFACLHQKMLDAQNRPHLAFVAVQCLTALYPFVPRLRGQIKTSDVQEVQHFGDCHHLALAVASHKLLVALEA